MSPVILSAIDIIKSRFDGMDIVIVSDMIKGVNIKMMGVDVFLSYEISESILEWGGHIADQFVFMSLKDTFTSMSRDIKINSIISE